MGLAGRYTDLPVSAGSANRRTRPVGPGSGWTIERALGILQCLPGSGPLPMPPWALALLSCRRRAASPVHAHVCHAYASSASPWLYMQVGGQIYDELVCKWPRGARLGVDRR